VIVGLGIDLCQVSRIAELERRYGMRFLQRVFTEGELSRCRNPRRLHECLAGRFAAKEAALKALGTGLSQGIAWHDVELVGGESQRPRIAFHRRAGEIFKARGATTSCVSVSHDSGFAAAVVILEGDPG
jgi:holo-[acyl-carrier protein] synthase